MDNIAIMITITMMIPIFSKLTNTNILMMVTTLVIIINCHQ